MLWVMRRLPKPEDSSDEGVAPLGFGFRRCLKMMMHRVNPATGSHNLKAGSILLSRNHWYTNIQNSRSRLAGHVKQKAIKQMLVAPYAVHDAGIHQNKNYLRVVFVDIMQFCMVM